LQTAAKTAARQCFRGLRLTRPSCTGENISPRRRSRPRDDASWFRPRGGLRSVPSTARLPSCPRRRGCRRFGGLSLGDCDRPIRGSTVIPQPRPPPPPAMSYSLLSSSALFKSLGASTRPADKEKRFTKQQAVRHSRRDTTPNRIRRDDSSKKTYGRRPSHTADGPPLVPLLPCARLPP